MYQRGGDRNIYILYGSVSVLSVYFVKYLIISKDYIIFFLIPFYVLYIPINYFVLLFYIRGGFSPDISDKKTLYFRIFFIDLNIKSMYTIRVR